MAIIDNTTWYLIQPYFYKSIGKHLVINFSILSCLYSVKWNPLVKRFKLNLRTLLSLSCMKHLPKTFIFIISNYFKNETIWNREIFTREHIQHSFLLEMKHVWQIWCESNTSSVLLIIISIQELVFYLFLRNSFVWSGIEV